MIAFASSFLPPCSFPIFFSFFLFKVSVIFGIIGRKICLFWPFLFLFFSVFSLSFKVERLDVKVGGLSAGYCRQIEAFTLSLYCTVYFQNVDGSNLSSSHFFCKPAARTYRCNEHEPCRMLQWMSL